MEFHAEGFIAELNDWCGKAILGGRTKELRVQIKFSDGHFLGICTKSLLEL